MRCGEGGKLGQRSPGSKRGGTEGSGTNEGARGGAIAEDRSSACDRKNGSVTSSTSAVDGGVASDAGPDLRGDEAPLFLLLFDVAKRPEKLANDSSIVFGVGEADLSQDGVWIFLTGGGAR